MITQYLTSSKLSTQTLCSLSIEQLQLRDPAHSKSHLMRCPTEILQIIVSHLPLRSAINLHASSHRLSALVNTSEGEFWRSHTLRLHDPWFWELRDHQGFSSESFSYMNWEKLLKILSLSRREILKGAQSSWLESPVNRYVDVAGNRQHVDDENTPSLPLGLRNRQRKWMCLESLNIVGEEKKR